MTVLFSKRYIFIFYKSLFIFSFPPKRSFNFHQDHKLHFILQLMPSTVECADWVDDDVIMRLYNSSCTQLLVTVGPGLQWQTRQTDGLAHSWEESSDLFVDSALRTSSLLYYQSVINYGWFFHLLSPNFQLASLLRAY